MDRTGTESRRSNGPEVPDHEVAVIGAGIGGIGMGIALLRAGMTDFTILERAADIGGTWRDNTYPGVAVDVPAQAYQFSFELNPTWSRVFAHGAEVKRYVDHCADQYGVRPHIRCDADVRSRTWDDDAHLWRLDVSGQEATARFVVSAIGAFVEPKPIDIAGLDEFTGAVLRSSSWDHEHDLSGERVAIIGTGASAVQIIPEIAPIVGHLDVYQRTPIWVAPKIDPLTPPQLQSLFRRVPLIQRIVQRTATRSVELVLIDLSLRHHRVPFVARGVAALARNIWYRSQVRDAEVRRKLTPDYGIGCKRPAVSSAYLKTFNRPNVELVSDPIDRITPSGIRTVDGRERAIDTLVLATGFRMSSDPETYRLRPVRGRDGFDLATFYVEQRLASYESVALPGLPNHFMIFGPYGWVGGTWHQLVESASAHIVRVLEETRRRGATCAEATPEATDRWTAEMRGRMETSLFNTNNCAGANSYYFDHHGDTPFLRPTSSAAARRAAATFPFADYHFTGSPPPAPHTSPDSAAVRSSA
jgi:cation diffusion facilitator CzcD-associated flavoprotein CzcO